MLEQGALPHLDEVIRELTDLNINTLCYINPHLAMEGRLYAEASKVDIS